MYENYFNGTDKLVLYEEADSAIIAITVEYATIDFTDTRVYTADNYKEVKNVELSVAEKLGNDQFQVKSVSVEGIDGLENADLFSLVGTQDGRIDPKGIAVLFENDYIEDIILFLNQYGYAITIKNIKSVSILDRGESEVPLDDVSLMWELFKVFDAKAANALKDYQKYFDISSFLIDKTNDNVIEYTMGEKAVIYVFPQDETEG